MFFLYMTTSCIFRSGILTSFVSNYSSFHTATRRLSEVRAAFATMATDTTKYKFNRKPSPSYLLYLAHSLLDSMLRVKDPQKSSKFSSPFPILSFPAHYPSKLNSIPSWASPKSATFHSQMQSLTFISSPTILPTPPHPRTIGRTAKASSS